MRKAAISIACAFAFAAGAQAQDAARGKTLYDSRCVACHSVDDNRVGPAHKGVFGRKAGAAKDYDYSAALKMSKVVWNEKSLDLWLTGPEQFIPGQKMGFSVPEVQDRRDLIAYLRLVSESKK